MSCVNALQNPQSLIQTKNSTAQRRPDYAWTDLTYLLHKSHVSWAYYVANGTQPDCDDDAMFCQQSHKMLEHLKFGILSITSIR
jgi:hypothetical protein